MSARQRLSRLCYVGVMAMIPGEKRARATLLVLVILAIALMGILPAHQGLGLTTATDSAPHSHAHELVSTSDHLRDPVGDESGATGAAPADISPAHSAGEEGPAPVCHGADSPLATSPDRCPQRDSDQLGPPEPGYFPAPLVDTSQPWGRSVRTCPQMPTSGVELLAAVCVLRT